MGSIENTHLSLFPSLCVCVFAITKRLTMFDSFDLVKIFSLDCFKERKKENRLFLVTVINVRAFEVSIVLIS